MKLNLIGIAVAVLMAVLAYKMYKDSDMFQLKCIISAVDGNSYCVRDREQITSAAAVTRATLNPCWWDVHYWTTWESVDEESVYARWCDRNLTRWLRERRCLRCGEAEREWTRWV